MWSPFVRDRDAAVRIAAVGQMTDNFNLKYIAEHDRDERVRDVARRRLNG